tara:strand:- start:565 stop:795 length:231 start_codon:yes stop_codon:yes gene_type:complete
MVAAMALAVANSMLLPFCPPIQQKIGCLFFIILEIPMLNYPKMWMFKHLFFCSGRIGGHVNGGLLSNTCFIMNEAV